MKDKVNDKISIMKLIKASIDKAGFTQKNLSVKSGVSEGNLSKFLNEKIVYETGFGRNANNLLSVLIALDLIKSEGEIKEICPVKCDDETRELCAEVKEVIESNTHWSDSLIHNIHSFKAGVDIDKNDLSKKSKSDPTRTRSQKPHGKKKVA